MNIDTGAIATFETEVDAKLAGYNVPLSRNMAGRMIHLSRETRIAWAKKLLAARERSRAARKARKKQRRAR